jgi:hypothetical protein
MTIFYDYHTHYVIDTLGETIVPRDDWENELVYFNTTLVSVLLLENHQLLLA